VADAAADKPHLKVMCGFSRRFDASYREAYARASSGAIGAPAVFRSQTCDKLDPSGFFVAYAAFSGGIFVDCNIHDIDLALWFFSARAPDGSLQLPAVKSAYAVGVTAVSPELRKHGDVDNGVGVVEFWGGRIAYFYSSRMMAAGQHDMSEVIATKGKVTVNAAPASNLVEMHEPSGIRREIPPDYYGRFKEAFVTEANEWTEWVLDKKEGLPGGMTLDCAVKAVAIGNALQESLRSGKKIVFDENGRRKAEQSPDRARL
jgi:myo-inositol 2-dehydrogenase/D-chiro-inositol 1-dehydrogenase